MKPDSNTVDTPLGKGKRFSAANFAPPLRIPEGTVYLEPSTEPAIGKALEAGYAVYVQSCDGRAFVWPSTEGGYVAEHFFIGPPTEHRFATAAEAASFAAELCE